MATEKHRHLHLDCSNRSAVTRSRIVDAAARLFRRDGYQSTGVDRLMGEVGLTRGGFYAHFRDKADLFGEALGAAFEQSRATLFERGLESERGAAWVDAATTRYLRAEHRADWGSGCAAASLGAEVMRAPDEVRRRFSQEIDTIVELAAERIEGEDRRERALGLLATWVGALVIARAISNNHAAVEVLEAAKAASRRLVR